MLKIRQLVLSTILLLSFFACNQSNELQLEGENYDWQAHYTKTETIIPMRDGVNLFTSIYTPKDTSQSYPILLQRTPYSCRPYGEDTLPGRIFHNEAIVKSGYIFVFQDVRGRWKSEGDYENTKPPYSLFDSTKTDELTDSYDTFEWLLKNVKHYNGNAGMHGTSYPGWTTLVGARCNHPSLKAVIASAPVTNFYFEDFNRYGIFALNYLPVISGFGTPRLSPIDTAWWVNKNEVYGIDDSLNIRPDYYDFFLDRMSLANFDDILDSTDFFWQFIREHREYDEARKLRDWEQYYNDIQCQVMVLGGWNDEQNLYGILNSFKHIEAHSPKANAQFVMGPWSHGHPTRADSTYYLGNVFYGFNLSTDFMEEIEFPYYEKHLKGIGTAPDFKVKLFDTGKNEWAYFKEYPKETAQEATYFLYDGKMNKAFPEIKRENSYTTFIADPFHPVPYIEGDEWYGMAPKHYFTDDQRFVSKRPDVLSFESDILTENLTVLGEIKALIEFATDHGDADLYVKVIDVYPMDRVPLNTDPEGVKMNGYQQLVRAGYIRGRYRNGFEKGIPFSKNQKTSVAVPLLDIFHTFKKGHKIMIQIHSSWFPLFDLNPQNYVEDVYTAKRQDFAVAMHKVFASSKIVFPVYKP